MTIPKITREREQSAKRFNEALRFRGHDKKTLTELTTMFGSAKSLLCNLRNGRALPSIATAKRICDTLNISFEWFLTGVGTINGFQMNNADEIALMFRYRSLTQRGRRELIKAAFNDNCCNHELTPSNKSNRLDQKQALLKLVSKD